jgi:hypothetical protein
MNSEKISPDADQSPIAPLGGRPTTGSGIWLTTNDERLTADNRFHSYS